ncbi:hypothetical protein DPEC_G00377740 [Dallia pectoralis]|nr:hypothetical protein DPEC_G00377740 [Dallia pectoralis]
MDPQENLRTNRFSLSGGDSESATKSSIFGNPGGPTVKVRLAATEIPHWMIKHSPISVVKLDERLAKWGLVIPRLLMPRPVHFYQLDNSTGLLLKN